MLRRVAMMIAGAALLAGCGGGSSSPDAEKTGPTATTAAPQQKGLTIERLVKALPSDDSFPKGSEVTVRCPGDPECANEAVQDQDASVSVNLALPAGAERDRSSVDGEARFRVDGGEWSEHLWLRAWLYDDMTSAKGFRVDFQKDAEKLVGPLDVPAKKTDSGYDYGIRGTGSLDEVTIDGWRGFVRVLDAAYIHLDGRVTDKRFDVFAVMAKDNAFIRVDSSFTVQGRDKADAVKTVRDLLTAYLEKL